MADTYTEFLNLTKPEVGASRDTWGDKYNANFQALDTWAKGADAAIKAVAGKAVLKAGDEMSGALRVAADGPQLIVGRKDKASAFGFTHNKDDDKIYFQSLKADGTVNKSLFTSDGAGNIAIPGVLSLGDIADVKTAIANAANVAVRKDMTQLLTESEKGIARGNIGAASFDDLRAFGRQIAKQSPTVIQTGTLMIDEFVNKTGFDNAASVNWVFDAANGVIANQTPATVQKFPVMTSNTAPAGYSYTASNASTVAWQANKGQDGNFNPASWYGNGFGSGEYIEVQAQGRPLYISQYRVQGWYTFNYGNNQASATYPASWQVVGSNDDWASEAIIDAQSGQGTQSVQTYNVDPAKIAPFKRVRFRLLSSGRYGTDSPGAHTVSIFDFYEKLPGAPMAMSLKSIIAPCTETPVKASIWVAINALQGTVDLTPGTGNVSAKVTRGGGVYTPAVLQKLLSFNGWTFARADGIDLSGLPVDTKPAYQIDVANTVGLQIDTVEFGYGK